jgi:hypothetical protein
MVCCDRSRMSELWATIHLPVTFTADCPQSAILTMQNFCLRECQRKQAFRIIQMLNVDAEWGDARVQNMWVHCSSASANTPASRNSLSVDSFSRDAF